MAINYVAVLVTALVSFTVGWVWHGPLFGKLWMRLSNITPAKMKAMQQKNMAGVLVMAILTTLATSTILAVLLSILTLDPLLGALRGALLGSLIWLGIALPIHVGNVLWEGRSVKLFLFNTIYAFVNLVLMGAILAAWM